MPQPLALRIDRRTCCCLGFLSAGFRVGESLDHSDAGIGGIGLPHALHQGAAIIQQMMVFYVGGQGIGCLSVGCPGTNRMEVRFTRKEPPELVENRIVRMVSRRTEHLASLSRMMRVKATPYAQIVTKNENQ